MTQNHLHGIVGITDANYVGTSHGMPLLNIFIAIAFLFSGQVIYGQQDNNSYKQVIAKVDSISKAKGIELAIAKSLQVTTIQGETETANFSLAKRAKYKFDGPFLVIGNSYFNLEKLIYFVIKEDCIEFYFQSY